MTDTTDTTGDYEDLCQDEGDGDVDSVDCVGPVIEELELIGLDEVTWVRFADLDGDGNDELLGLGPGSKTLFALLDDDVVETPLGCTIFEPGYIGNVYPLHLDSDGYMDVLATTGDGERCVTALLGRGDGGFGEVDTAQEEWDNNISMLPSIGRGAVIDPELNGIDALAVIDYPRGRIGVHSKFWPDVSMPAWTNIGPLDGSYDLTAAQLDCSSAPDLLMTRADCEAVIRFGPEFASTQSLDAGTGDCRWLVGWFGGPTQQPISLGWNSKVLTHWSGDPLEPATRELSNRPGEAVLLESGSPGNPRLVVSLDGDQTLTMSALWNWQNFPDLCEQTLDVPYGALQAGDLDGDGVDELAVIAPWPESGVRVFSISSP